jgi:hypothetical protein
MSYDVQFFVNTEIKEKTAFSPPPSFYSSPSSSSTHPSASYFASSRSSDSPTASTNAHNSNSEYKILTSINQDNHQKSKVHTNHSNSSSSNGGNYAPHRHHNTNRNRLKNDGEDDDELVVNTQNGYIRGKRFFLDYHIPRNHRPRSFPFGRKKYRVNGWLGIPFAEKPINDLRFKRPVPVKNWDGVKNTTELPNSCYQLPDTVISDFMGVEMWNANTDVNEDCLYLNVWTPDPKPRNSAVLVIL